MSRKAIVMFISAIFVFGVCLYAGIYLVRSQGCVDGRGTDTYFEKTDLTSPENLERFDISNVEVIAQYSQSCAIRAYTVRGNWGLKKVSQDEFRAYIEHYNAGCANCLLVHKTGWPYSGEIFEVASDRHICSTGTRAFENCIILQLAGPTIVPKVTVTRAPDEPMSSQSPRYLSPTPPTAPTDVRPGQAMGVLAGQVTIGPLTPVEIQGWPTPTPPPEIYAGRKILIFAEDGQTEISQVSIEPDGTYRVELPAGTYVVDINRLGIDRAAGLPQTVQIDSGGVTRLDVDIDTGIR